MEFNKEAFIVRLSSS